MVRYTHEQLENASAGGLPPEGKYLAEIIKAEEKRSVKTGDPFFNVQFKNVHDGNPLCFDVIMAGGRGLGIGHKKLRMLGAVEEHAVEWNVEAHNLIGLRAVLTIKHETFVTAKGESRVNAKVDFEANDETTHFGYAHESTWVNAIETPF